MRGIYILTLFIITGLFSCGINEEDILFEMRYDVNFTMGAALAPIVTHIYTLEGIKTGFSEKLNDNSVTDNEVIKVNTSFARIYDVFGTSNLNFIDKIEVYVYNPDEPSQKWLAAIEDPVLNNVKDEIKLFPAITDFKDIVSGELINIEIKIRLRDISPEEIDCRLELTMLALNRE